MTEARFRFDPLRPADLALVHEWLARPHVAAWWHPTPSLEELRDDYFAPSEGVRAVSGFIARAGSRAIGFVQCYVVAACGGGWWPDETDPGARGIDQFLAETRDLG